MVCERMIKEKCQGPRRNSLQTREERDKEWRDKGAFITMIDTHDKLLALDNVNGRFVCTVNLHLVALDRRSISLQAATVWWPHRLSTGLRGLKVCPKIWRSLKVPNHAINVGLMIARRNAYQYMKQSHRTRLKHF